MWIVDGCWSRGFNYAEYVSWYEIYATGTDLGMVTELEYVKACADLDDEVKAYADLDDEVKAYADLGKETA